MISPPYAITDTMSVAYCTRARNRASLSLITSRERFASATNRAIDAQFRGRYGASYIVPREAYMTQVYNYFALPPALGSFCDTALAISQESLLVPPGELDGFAARTLPRVEGVFDAFYRAYEKYRVDAALWDAQYAPPPPPPAPLPTLYLPQTVVSSPPVVSGAPIVSGPLVQAIPGGAATTPRPAATVAPVTGTLVLPPASLPQAPVSSAAVPPPASTAPGSG